MKDYYKILAIDRYSTEKDIKRSYRELALKFHPDVASDPVSAVRFTEINEAYQVLGKKDSREDYNLKYDYWKHHQSPTPKKEKPGKSHQPYSSTRYYGPAYTRKDEQIDLTPYVRTVRFISGFSLLFVFLIILDYFLPNEIHEQTIRDKLTTYNSYNTIIITTEKYDFPISYNHAKLIFRGDRARISISPIFNIRQGLYVDTGVDSYEFKPHYSIYNVYSFFLLILLITSFMGTFNKESNPELIFSAGVANVFLVGLIMYLVYIS